MRERFDPGKTVTRTPLGVRNFAATSGAGIGNTGAGAGPLGGTKAPNPATAPGGPIPGTGKIPPGLVPLARAMPVGAGAAIGIVGGPPSVSDPSRGMTPTTTRKC